MTLEQLSAVLHDSWSATTAYHADRKKWSPDNKAIGQCTVTAMIVYDYFGGKIVRGYSEKYKLYHYWNEINGEKIDLTSSQFFPDRNDISFSKIVYKDKRSLLRIKDVKDRYIILKEKVEIKLMESSF